MNGELGVLPNGDLVRIWQVHDFNEETQMWERYDIGADYKRIETQTFLPFLWGYSTWELALKAFEDGRIKNIHQMKRYWRVK